MIPVKHISAASSINFWQRHQLPGRLKAIAPKFFLAGQYWLILCAFFLTIYSWLDGLAAIFCAVAGAVSLAFAICVLSIGTVFSLAEKIK